jgi:hypothetical protein
LQLIYRNCKSIGGGKVEKDRIQQFWNSAGGSLMLATSQKSIIPHGHGIVTYRGTRWNKDSIFSFIAFIIRSNTNCGFHLLFTRCLPY